MSPAQKAYYQEAGKKGTQTHRQGGKSFGLATRAAAKFALYQQHHSWAVARYIPPSLAVKREREIAAIDLPELGAKLKKARLQLGVVRKLDRIRKDEKAELILQEYTSAGAKRRDKAISSCLAFVPEVGSLSSTAFFQRMIFS